VCIFPQTRSEHYVTHRHNFELQTALVSKPSALLSWKAVNRCKFRSPYAWWEWKLSWLLSFGFWNLMTSRENDLLMMKQLYLLWDCSINTWPQTCRCVRLYSTSWLLCREKNTWKGSPTGRYFMLLAKMCSSLVRKSSRWKRRYLIFQHRNL